MSNKEEHPCNNCIYFYGWEEIEIGLKGMCIETIHVDIPICNRTIYVIALNKCEYFKYGHKK